MNSHVVSAPGKMMLAGEYVVLEGAEALVAAVGRRAYAQLGAGVQEVLPPEAAAARAAAEHMLGPIVGALAIDVTDLKQDDRKLGLGSSAAAAAAAAGAVFAAHGHDVKTASVRQDILSAALEGHRAVAPHGSGADVAAAVLGGFVRFRKLGEGVETHSVSWPAALELVVVWTGTAVRTSDMLAQVRAFSVRDASAYRTRMHALADQAEQLVSAVIAGEIPAIVDSFHSYGTAMGELGIAAGIGIIDDTCKQIRRLAQDCGGGAKPSGAGGGDIAIATFSTANSANAFRSRCATEGFEVLSLELGEPGERDEEQW